MRDRHENGASGGTGSLISRWAGMICPWPEVRGRPVQRWNPWLVAWHVVFYGILASATLSTVTDERARAQRGIALGVSLLLAGWYGYWLVLREDRMIARSTARVLYFSVAAVLWALLLAVDAKNYSILSIAGFVQAFGYLEGRAALAAAAMMTVLFTASRAFAGGLGTAEGLRWVGLSAVDVIWPLLVLFVVSMLFLFMRDVVRKSTERQQLIDELHATRNELAIAERHAGMLKERERLAAELHDTLTQELTSIVMLLEAAQASLAAGSPTGTERVGQALRAARASLREVRRVVWSLRPETLERGTLAQALGRLASDLSKQSDISARTVVTGQERELATDVEVTLFRAAQEALANVRRHSGAREVTLTLSFMDDVVVLDVRDDGAGFDAGLLPIRPGVRGGLGLLSMRERIEALHGSLTVETAPGEGTTVVAAIPLEHAPVRGERPEPSDAPVR